MDQAACATEQIEDAAKDGDLALVRKLLDDGANVEGPDDSWTTPLFWACRKGYDDVERYLGVIRLLNGQDAAGLRAPVPGAGPRDADRERGARVSPRRPPPGLLEAPLRSDFRARPRTRRRRRRVPRAPLGIVPRRRRPPQEELASNSE